MYYIDTPTGNIDAFDYDATTGNISNRRTAIKVPDGKWLARWHVYRQRR
jgi:sugar lactone lactonase YvrE